MSYLDLHILSDIIPYTASHLKDRMVVEAWQRLSGNESGDLYVPLQPSVYPSVFPMIKDKTALPMSFGPGFRIDNMEFCSPFHYYYFLKAYMFEDYETAFKILNIHDSYSMQLVEDARSLVSHVKNFKKEVWDSCYLRIAYEANKHKAFSEPWVFSQLLSTYGKCLSWFMPHDKIGGYVNCGEDWTQTINVHGENRMGNILNLLRDDIITMLENYDKWKEKNVERITMTENEFFQIRKGFFNGIDDYWTVQVNNYIYVFTKRYLLSRFKFIKNEDGKL